MIEALRNGPLVFMSLLFNWLKPRALFEGLFCVFFFYPDVLLILHPFSYEVNTCVDPPHEQKIVALEFQPQKRKDPDMTLLAVTAGGDGKFKIWVLGEERLGRSKNKQKIVTMGTEVYTIVWFLASMFPKVLLLRFGAIAGNKRSPQS